MGRTRDRVLVDAVGGSEKTGDEIEGSILGQRGDDDAPRLDGGQQRKIGSERTDSGFCISLDEPVKGGAPGEARRDTERVDELTRRSRACNRTRGKIHLDPPARFCTGEQSAFRMEPRRGGFGEAALLPQDMGGGEGGVAAQIDFGGGGEPAKAKGFFYRTFFLNRIDVGGLGEIHLHRQRLHPRFVRRAVQQADRRRVPGEGF